VTFATSDTNTGNNPTPRSVARIRCRIDFI
jgi:hypothetical protein